MLLVIFGAGASYDSVPHLPPPKPAVGWLGSQEDDRPPLANELFENRAKFVEAMDRFGTCKPIIPLLRKPGVVVERELARLQEQAKKFPDRHRQLAAIRYYLHVALWECQKRWHGHHKGITNYATLLDEIERWRFEHNETVCFVTFNYDTILEDAMAQRLPFSVRDLGSYVSHSAYILVKLHGSVNWGREVEGAWAADNCSNEQLIDHAAELRISNRFRLVSQQPMLREGGRVVFPALSIPVAKKDEFACPQEHVQALDEALPKVTKILTVGWRGTEAEFLTKLQSKLRGGPRLMVVSGDDQGATEALNNLKSSHVLCSDTVVVADGFTGLINDLDLLSRLLRAPRG